MRAALLRFGALLCFALALASCVTPSIPIPPPDPALMRFEIDITPGGVSTATFSYPPRDNYVDSIVYLYNQDTGSGIIERAHPDGSVGPTAPLGITAGDQVVVTFEKEDQTVSTCIRVRDGVQSSTDYCN